MWCYFLCYELYFDTSVITRKFSIEWNTFGPGNLLLNNKYIGLKSEHIAENTFLRYKSVCLFGRYSVIFCFWAQFGLNLLKKECSTRICKAINKDISSIAITASESHNVDSSEIDRKCREADVGGEHFCILIFLLFYYLYALFSVFEGIYMYIGLYKCI